MALYEVREKNNNIEIRNKLQDEIDELQKKKNKFIREINQLDRDVNELKKEKISMSNT